MGLFSRKGSNELLQLAAIARAQASHVRKTHSGISVLIDTIEDGVLEVIYGQEGVGLGNVKLALLTENYQPRGTTGEDILRNARDSAYQAANKAKAEGFADASAHFQKGGDICHSILLMLGYR